MYLTRYDKRTTCIIQCFFLTAHLVTGHPSLASDTIHPQNYWWEARWAASWPPSQHFKTPTLYGKPCWIGIWNSHEFSYSEYSRHFTRCWYWTLWRRCSSCLSTCNCKVPCLWRKDVGVRYHGADTWRVVVRGDAPLQVSRSHKECTGLVCGWAETTPGGPWSSSARSWTVTDCVSSVF